MFQGVQKLARFVRNNRQQRGTSNYNKIVKESLFNAWIKNDRIVLLKNRKKIKVTNEFLAVYENDKKRTTGQKPKTPIEKSLLLINTKKERHRPATIIR